jgi:hypothetical protein
MTAPLAESLAPWVRAIFAAGPDPVTVLDPDPGPGVPSTPTVWVTWAGAILGGRDLAGHARTVSDAVRCVCSAATAQDAARLAWDLGLMVDGAKLAGDVLRVTNTTPPIEDRDDVSAYRWSSAVDIVRNQPRG